MKDEVKESTVDEVKGNSLLDRVKKPFSFVKRPPPSDPKPKRMDELEKKLDYDAPQNFKPISSRKEGGTVITVFLEKDRGKWYIVNKQACPPVRSELRHDTLRNVSGDVCNSEWVTLGTLDGKRFTLKRTNVVSALHQLGLDGNT